MFFYSAQSRALRRLSIAPQGSETRPTRQIPEAIPKQSITSIIIEDKQEEKEQERKEQKKDQRNHDQRRILAIRSSSLANTPCFPDIQVARKSNRYYYRRPTLTIDDDGRIIFDALGLIFTFKCTIIIDN
ncbi:unnamed protein product [Onchocerca flexuosa]|uniref:Uncharacterized protein n=1 Tax=Onchocerca flexuosa TaxID=387005 RepID=A0A183HXR5_9BILA|nr:unnamed protein product [Onchocerca flexuosa]